MYTNVHRLYVCVKACKFTEHRIKMALRMGCGQAASVAFRRADMRKFQLNGTGGGKKFAIEALHN